MNAKEIRNQLMKAFGVTTSKELKKYLGKTDLRSKAEMLQAAWSLYLRSNKTVKSKKAVEKIIDSLTGRQLTQITQAA